MSGHKFASHKIISACFHTFCSASLPILLLYAVNIEQLVLRDALLLISSSGLLALGVLFLAAHFFDDLYKVSISISLVIFMMMSHGHLTRILLFTGLYKTVGDIGDLVFWFVLLISGLLLIHLRIRDFDKFASFINAMALVLIITNLIPIVSFHFGNTVITDDSIESLRTIELKQRPSDELPDIYYIIVDGYAREDVLLRLYNFDNGKFVNRLTERGFYCASASNANYIQTNLSLASSLNMSYLNNLATKLPSHENSLYIGKHLISQSVVAILLKRAGYKTVAFESGYDVTELRNADYYHSESLVSRQFLIMAAAKTTIIKLMKYLFRFSFDLSNKHAESINKLFDNLVSLTVKSYPMFVFAHICCPHPPFVFKEDGSFSRKYSEFSINDGSHLDMNVKQYRQDYVAQLKYMNKKIEDLVNLLQRPANRPKVIIFQSDHGPGSSLDWDSKENSNMKERFGILNAIYFSDQDYCFLYPSVSPVNTFRVIFNKYLGTNLELLEDRHFFSTWGQRFSFIEVTSELKIDEGTK